MSSIVKTFSFPSREVLSSHLSSKLNLEIDTEASEQGFSKENVIQVITGTFAEQTCEVSGLKRCLSNVAIAISPKQVDQATEHLFNVMAACATVAEDSMPRWISSH